MDFSNLILKVLCFYEKSIVTYTAAATPFLPAREITHANPELFLTFEKTALYNKSTQNGVSVQWLLILSFAVFMREEWLLKQQQEQQQQKKMQIQYTHILQSMCIKSTCYLITVKRVFPAF